MDLRDYVSAARRRWWIIVGAALVGAVLAWISAPSGRGFTQTRYEAAHTLTVEPETRVFTPENPETIAILAESGELPGRVAERVGLEAGSLLAKVDVVGDSTLGLITITSTDTDPDRAELLADEYALTLVAHLDEQEQLAQDDAIETARVRADDLDAESRQADAELMADPENDVLRERRDALLRQYSAAYERYNALLAEARADSGLKSLGPAIATPAGTGISAPRSRPERAAVLGVIGLLLGSAVAIVLQRIDTRLGSKEDAETAFGMPVIAEIPTVPYRRRHTHEVISFSEPASPVAEAYRVLRTTMMILSPVPLPPVTSGPVTSLRRRASDLSPDEAPRKLRTGSELQVFLVTSTRPSEGKTTVAANLAAGFAETGRSVLVIGADVRRPELHHYLGVHRDPGLTDVMRGTRSLEQVIMPTVIPGVRVIPAGAAVTNPGELLLEGPSMLAQARELADIVIVDTTPMLTVNDAIQVMPGVDAVLMTSRSHRTTRPAARRAHEMLARMGVPVFGVVLVGAPSTPGVSSYYYGYQTRLSGSGAGRLRDVLRRRRAAPVVDPPIASIEAPAEDRRRAPGSLPTNPTNPTNPPTAPTPEDGHDARGAPSPIAPQAAPPRPAPTLVTAPPSPRDHEHPGSEVDRPSRPSTQSASNPPEPDPWGWP